MARSLAAIARRGPRAFYRGRIARLIDADMERTRQNPIAGDAAVLTAGDLAAYRAKWRRPLAGSFRGNGIVAMPPPTSAGVAVIEMLNLLEGVRPALRRAVVGRRPAPHRGIPEDRLGRPNEYLADPDFVRQPVDTLISKEYATRAARRAAWPRGPGPHRGRARRVGRAPRAQAPRPHLHARGRVWPAAAD
jgi:gamma-glutamyltranspeptidase / glutathione hydrolase